MAPHAWLGSKEWACELENRAILAVLPIQELLSVILATEMWLSNLSNVQRLMSRELFLDLEVYHRYLPQGTLLSTRLSSRVPPRFRQEIMEQKARTTIIDGSWNV